jgi:histone-lysine N-methyltransferase SETMAR
MARQIQVIQHLPFSPNLAPTDFFLFLKVKRELAGLTLNQKTFKKEWKEAVRTLLAADFATAFSRWYERCKKCVSIAGSYMEKS